MEAAQTSPSPSVPGQGAATLTDAFRACVRECGTDVALRSADGSLELTWDEYAARVDRLAGGLHALGVAPGDCVGMLTLNRVEAVLIDMATLHLGATPFSTYMTSSPEQIGELFDNADNAVAITQESLLPVLRKAHIPKVERIVVVDADIEGTMTLADLEAGCPDGFDAESHAAGVVTPDTVATLIYTSGTTGPSKGVQLSHANLMCSVSAAAESFAAKSDLVHPVDSTSRYISYLPFAHVADRFFAYYMHMYGGGSLTVLSDPTQVVATLPSVKPTLFLAVPRIWEKIMAALQAKGITDPAGLPAEVKAGVAAQLGLPADCMRACGAAPVAVEVLEFFGALGMEICEGWAMSETACHAILNLPGETRPGTIGRPVAGLETKVLDDGELLVRSPAIMKGYRKNPEKTAEALDAEGWLHTGDVVTVDEEGFITIVDRKKELIINAAGKNMSPSNIEQRLKAASPLIGQAVTIGDRRPYNTALLVLDPDGAAAWAAEQGLSDSSGAALAGNPALTPVIEAAVQDANAKLSRVEQIKKWTVLPVDWLPGGDELTPTMKLKRKPIAEKYGDEIEAMYAG